MERLLELTIYTHRKMSTAASLTALKAHRLFGDELCGKKEAIIVDEFAGRLMFAEDI